MSRTGATRHGSIAATPWSNANGVWGLLATLFGVLAGAGCADTELVAAPLPSVIAGQYCSDNSHNYDVPIRIALVIDSSTSMKDTDPTDNRAKAASDLVKAMVQKNEQVKFAIVSFGTDAKNLTGGFLDYAANAAAIDNAITSVGTENGYTNYVQALNTVRTMVFEDIQKVQAELQDLEAAGTNIDLLRPYYFIAFLSDGRPMMLNGPQNEDTILWQCEDMIEMGNEKYIMGVTMHAAYLSTTEYYDATAEVLLQRMAEKGRGSYFYFDGGDEVDFSLFQFVVKRLFSSQFFIVSNASARIEDGMLRPDSDGDGCTDAFEAKIGTDPLVPDTDGDLMVDCFEEISGLRPTFADSNCTDSAGDADKDGLLDCEERVANLCVDRFDCDGDLFPDDIEFFGGTNPGDGTDIERDSDFDGVSNALELLKHTNPMQDDADLHELYAYTYAIKQGYDRNTGVTCYDFNVENVGIVPTLETATTVAGDNTIYIYYIESPKDDAENQFTLRRKTIHINAFDLDLTKTNILRLTAADFEEISTQEGRKD